jgi:hypothetical protein
VQITILRHGKPDFEWQRNIKGSEFREIEREYDSAGIVGSPPHETYDLAEKHQYIVCSDFPRSIQSAKALGVSNVGRIWTRPWVQVVFINFLFKFQPFSLVLAGFEQALTNLQSASL